MPGQYATQRNQYATKKNTAQSAITFFPTTTPLLMYGVLLFFIGIALYLVGVGLRHSTVLAWPRQSASSH